MRLFAFLACVLSLNGCSLLTNVATNGYTISLTPVTLGPVGVGQVSFTANPVKPAK